MAADKKSFEKAWAGFIEKYTKGMINAAKEEKPTVMVANKILDRVMTVWSDEKEECGRWLIIYCDKYPRSGRKICDVLENMSIKSHSEPKGINKKVKQFLPLCLGVLTFAVLFFTLEIVWAIIGAVIMLGIARAVVYAINDSVKASRDKEVIGEYVAELNYCKERILTMIE